MKLYENHTKCNIYFYSGNYLRSCSTVKLYAKPKVHRLGNRVHEVGAQK